MTHSSSVGRSSGSPRPLFFIGNKRSGTSLLVRLLNLHGGVFVTHEADVIWLLYQAREKWPDSFVPYEWDGPLGLARTLEVCEPVLRRARRREDFDPHNLFLELQLHRLGRRGRKRRATELDLEWIGDKKPVQQCDPNMIPFLTEHFPTARLIHIVRHPAAVTASMISAAETWKQGVPNYWKMGPETILERWATHEEWALALHENESFEVLWLRLEDLAQDVHSTMETVFRFLELEPIGPHPNDYRNVNPDPNEPYRGSSFLTQPRISGLMKKYGYSSDEV